MNAQLKQIEDVDGARPTEPAPPQNVYQAISAVMADLAQRGIAKGQTNTYDKYKFRGIDDLYNALGPALARHRLVVLPRIVDMDRAERTSSKGGVMFHVTLTAEIDFVSADDGSKYTVRAIGEAMDRGDKAVNKAMTAAYKYACFEAFCIPVEGTPDADSESPEVQHVTPESDWLAGLELVESLADYEALKADLMAATGNRPSGALKRAFAAKLRALQPQQAAA